MLHLIRQDTKKNHGHWIVPAGLNLLMLASLAASATGQDLPSDDDLFNSSTSSQPSTDLDSASPGPSSVAAARLVRVVQDAKTLYSDRTRKIVYDCKLFSDDSRVYHGKYIEYYRNGREFCRGEYRDGRRHGKWTFRRLADGSLGKQGTYVDDKPNGKWLVLRPDGSTMREETYKDGVSHGMWVTFSADGKTPPKKVEFANGKPVSE